MAVGFTPKFIEEYPLDNLSATQFLVIAHESVNDLGWETSYISPTGIIAYTANGVFGWNAVIRITIENDTATVKSSSAGRELFDFGRNKKAVRSLFEAIDEFKSKLSVEDIDGKYLQLSANFPPADDDYLKLPPPGTAEQINGFLTIFKPQPGYFVTPVLVNLNILVFILMAIKGVDILSPTSADLLNWGANFKPLTLDGQWWRLLANVFLHIGILHLLLNMYALVYIGLLLEPHLGKLRFITAYLLTGLLASVTSLWWHENTVSAGASGAIFGMYGVFLAMLTTDLIEKSTRRALLTSIAVFVGYNLLNGLKSGVDAAAHIGGLASGLIIGYCFTLSLKKPADIRLKHSLIAILTVITLIASGWMYKTMPNDIGDYDKGIEMFTSNEAKALEVYNMKDAPRQKLLTAIKNGIGYWNEDIKILERLDKLDVPEQLKTRDKKLKQYLDLRIKSFAIMYKAVDENTDKYAADMNYYNREIQVIIDSMKVTD